MLSPGSQEEANTVGGAFRSPGMVQSRRQLISILDSMGAQQEAILKGERLSNPMVRVSGQ
jgi:hypothetical protein